MLNNSLNVEKVKTLRYPCSRISEFKFIIFRNSKLCSITKQFILKDLKSNSFKI